MSGPKVPCLKGRYVARHELVCQLERVWNVSATKLYS